jgi:hypothetical protein
LKGGGVRVIGYLQMRAVGGVVEGPGFAEQDQLLRQWAERHGHEVVRTVVDRCSAATPSPGLVGSLRAVQAGDADALAVTSRSRLPLSQPVGVQILAVDEPEPRSAPQAGGRPRSLPRRGNVRAVVASLVAAAAAAGLAALGVAAAGTPDSLSWMEGRCVSHRLEVMPCDGNELARVFEVDPPYGWCAFTQTAERHQNGTWLCLDYR